MGIEDVMKGLAAAIQENTEALVAHTSLLKGGIASKKAPSKGDAPVEEVAPKKEKAKIAKKPAKKAELTIDDVKVAFGEYLSTDDKQLRDERKRNVGAILAGFKVKQVRDLSEDQYEEAIEMLKEYVDNEEVSEVEEDDDDESLI